VLVADASSKLVGCRFVPTVSVDARHIHRLVDDEADCKASSSHTRRRSRPARRSVAIFRIAMESTDQRRASRPGLGTDRPD
jgi:hypothetical protein